MKRATLMLCTGAVIGLTGAAWGQWSDDFESYDTVTPLPQQPDSLWEAWGGAAAAGQFFATTDQAYGGAQSVAIDNAGDQADDAVVQYTGYSEGVWAYTAWQFIPTTAADLPTYFILLNSYDGGGDLTNWSMQIQFDPTRMVVESEFEGETVGLTVGEWVEIYNIIDLDQDQQTIYYDGKLLSQKSWTEGLSGGGELNIAAVDLWGNATPYATYYDDMSLAEVPPFGACCFLDGSCLDDQSEGNCIFQGGIYQGAGTSCDLVYCPELGDCGWIVEAPIEWSGDTTEEEDSCDLRDGRDAQFEVILAYDAEWTFSVCDAQWDTYLYLTDACCSDGEIIAQNDDHPDCGSASKIIIELTAGTYYLTVEGFSPADFGPFPLEITSPCIVECDPDCLVEGEPICEDLYIDVFNGGCNSDPPVFSDMECGQCMCGTAGTFASAEGTPTRDTDWYEFPLTVPDTLVTLGGIGEFDLLLLLIDPGPGDCSETPEGDPTYEILGSKTNPACEEDSFNRVMGPTDEGYEYGWAFAGTDVFEGVACGSIYNMYLACEEPSECPADITGDGVVDVSDLLEVLSQWGGSGSADITGDGVVDVSDLLEVLSAWGPC